MYWDVSKQLTDCLSSDAKLRYVLLRVPNDTRQPCISWVSFLYWNRLMLILKGAPTTSHLRFLRSLLKNRSKSRLLL